MTRNSSSASGLLTIVVALSTAALFACASSSSGGGGGGESAPAAKAAAKPVPADSPLAKIDVGMGDEQVRAILGPPSTANAYITGKSFIPFYYGPDTSRTDWVYSGLGRVVFSRNRWSGGLKVIRVDYDPSL